MAVFLILLQQSMYVCITILKANTLKTRPIKKEVENVEKGNPFSCRINRLLICYLIYKQARHNS